MTRQRSSHEQKSLADRQAYFNTTIRWNPSPTFEDSEAKNDSTESTIPLGPEPTRPTQRPTGRKKKKHPLVLLLQEHWSKAAAGVVLAALISVIGWIVAQVYTLNREVGEIRVQVNANLTSQAGSKVDLQHEIDQINDRLNQAQQHH